jgi:hypothetical protein
VKENAELKEQQRKYATFVKVGFIFYIKLQWLASEKQQYLFKDKISLIAHLSVGIQQIVAEKTYNYIFRPIV